MCPGKCLHVSVIQMAPVKEEKGRQIGESPIRSSATNQTPINGLTNHRARRRLSPTPRRPAMAAPPRPIPSIHRQPPKPTTTHVARCFRDPPKAPDTNSNTNPLLSLLSAVPDWADAVSERRIRDRRPLYTHADWREHRSSRRHLRHLLSSLTSRVILSLAPPVSAFTAFAAAIATYNTLLPAYALTASSLPYQLTAPALALLLVFRTEASYARFDEGRKAWMRVIAAAADLAGMAMRHHNPPATRALLNYILAFPLALKVLLLHMFFFLYI